MNKDKMIDKHNLRDAVICKESDSILEVSRILRDTHSRHLIVVNEDQKPLGLISTVDINNRVVAEGKNSEETKASDIMTKPIETIDVNTKYGTAYNKMTEKGTYSIPVTENGKIIGMLSYDKMFTQLCEVKEK